jgi:RimJ/RimL family protein N-acetyltransferase
VRVAATAIIAADGLLLRVLQAQDAAAVVEATRTSDDAVWNPQPPPYTEEQAARFLAHYDARRQEGEAVSFGAFMDGSEALVAGLVLQCAVPGDIEVAYWVRPEQRGRRIASRSLEAISAWVERELAPQRLWVEVAPSNTASLRTAARAGYRRDEMRDGKLVLVRPGAPAGAPAGLGSGGSTGSGGRR